MDVLELLKPQFDEKHLQLRLKSMQMCLRPLFPMVKNYARY